VSEPASTPAPALLGGVMRLPEFAAHIAERPGALLGLDPGDKRIGIAVSDPTRLIASPLQTLTKTRQAADLTTIGAQMQARGCIGVVVGWPLNMDGSQGPSAQAARAFAGNLWRALRGAHPTGLPVLLWDERLSTAAVQRQMIAADVSRATRAEVVDQQAAAFMLQGALDRLRA